MKVQLDEADIIARAFENMVHSGREKEAATLAGKIIASIAMMYDDPNKYLDDFDSYTRDCAAMAKKMLDDMGV